MAVRKREPEAPRPLNPYGNPHPPEKFAQVLGRPVTQLDYEFWAFRYNWPIDKGGLPRYEHFKNIAKVLWPWLEFNPWMERGIEALCNNQWTAFAGCASSGKTVLFATYAVAWWLAAPSCSSVILTSTTKGMIRKRAWPWLQRLYTTIPGERIGNFLDSKTTWQCKKGDDLNAIFAIAVKEGSTSKAMGDIQGIHNKRILVGVDEGTDTPQAIFEVAANLITGCQDFQFGVIGNPASRFDPHGKFCEPKDGWKSITVDDDEWETIPQINGKTGICIHFDSEKSPNVLANEVKYRHLPTKAAVEGKRSKLGADSPLYWKFDRGFWAPEGISQTVLTESLLIKHNATGPANPFIWTGAQVFKIAGLDPAFGGGDRPTFKTATVGLVENGALCVQLGRREQLKVSVSKSTPIHYQLAGQVKELCIQENISPQFFGMDSTGEGGGLADVISREWSPDIIRVEFGGKASDMPVSNEDQRPCSEVYFNKVAELWYSIRELVTASQLRGINPQEGFELCNRLWRLNGRKIQVEPKSSKKLSGDAEEDSRWGYKERMKASPDEGDCIAVLVHVAKTHGVFPRITGQTTKRHENWLKLAQKLDDVNVPEEPEDTFDHPMAFSLED